MIGRIEISTEVTTALATALSSLRLVSEQSERLLEEVGVIFASIVPTRVTEALHQMRQEESREPAVLLAGVVPVDPDLPPTPSDSAEPVAPRTRIARAAVLGLARTLGEPVGYRAEKAGALVQDVFPIRSEDGAPSNESSRRALDLHTEIAFSRERPDLLLGDYSPDFLVLSCLRADAQSAPATILIGARDLCHRLSAQHLSMLRQPRFELQAPYSFTRDGDGSRPWVGPAALVAGEDDDPLLSLDLACGTRGRHPEAEEALWALRDAADDSSLRSMVQLSAGDALVIDNRRCLHGRTAFAPTYDGRDRWLQRVYVRRSLSILGATEGGGTRTRIL